MTGLSEAHAKWLEDRAINIETASRLGVESRGPSIAFKYTLNGKPLYAKLRDTREKSRMSISPSGVTQDSLFNEDCLQDDPKPTDVLVITEGELDAIAVAQVGYQFVVSLPSGAASTAEGCQKKAMKCLTIEDDKGAPILKPALLKFKRVVVMADNDHDGLLMRKAIIEIFTDEFSAIPSYPEGAKDANDVLKLDNGEALLRDMIEQSAPAMDDGFVDFMTAYNDLPDIKAMSCGIPFLHDHFRPVCPSLIVIGGQGGHGKSTIVQAILFNLLKANPHLRASIFHAEGDKKIPIRRAMSFWKGAFDPLHMSDAAKGARDEWIKQHLAFVRPGQGEAPTFKWLIKAMEHQALYRKRNVFVIDPWNQVLHDVGRQNKTDYVGDRIYELKRLAEAYKMIVIVAHHTTKSIDTSQPPGRYDLADSAHWVNAADHQIMIWKPREGDNASRLDVAKSKDHGIMGTPGAVWVTLDCDKARPFAIRKIEDPRRDGSEKTKIPKVAIENPSSVGDDQIADRPSFN